MAAAIAVTGLLAAEMGWRSLIDYRVTTQISWLRPVTAFRRANLLLNSASEFRLFLDRRGRKGLDPALIEKIEEHLLNQSRAPFEIEHSFWVGRQDSRDVREARDVAGENLQTGSSPPASIVVTTRASLERDALAMNAIVTEFTLDTLMREDLINVLTQIMHGARQKRLERERDVLLADQLLASLDNRIRDMTRLKEEHEKNVGTITDPAALTLNADAYRFLAPSRQIVGLETHRSERREQRRLDLDKIHRLQKTERFSETGLSLVVSMLAPAALERLHDELEAFQGTTEDELQRRELEIGKLDLQMNLNGTRMLFGGVSSYADLNPVVRKFTGGRAIAYGLGLIPLLIFLLWSFYRPTSSGQSPASSAIPTRMVRDQPYSGQNE